MIEHRMKWKTELVMEGLNWWIKERLDGWMNEWMDEQWMNKLVDELLNRWIWMNGCIVIGDSMKELRNETSNKLYECGGKIQWFKSNKLSPVPYQHLMILLQGSTNTLVYLIRLIKFCLHHRVRFLKLLLSFVYYWTSIKQVLIKLFINLWSFFQALQVISDRYFI